MNDNINLDQYKILCERCLHCEIKKVEDYKKGYFGYNRTGTESKVYICHNHKKNTKTHYKIISTVIKSCSFFSNSTLNHPELFENKA